MPGFHRDKMELDIFPLKLTSQHRHLKNLIVMLQIFQNDSTFVFFYYFSFTHYIYYVFQTSLSIITFLPTLFNYVPFCSFPHMCNTFRKQKSSIFITILRLNSNFLRMSNHIYLQVLQRNFCYWQQF